MSDTGTPVIEPLEHLPVDPELLEIYEVLEYVDHPDVMPHPPMERASALSRVPLPPGFVSRAQWGARSWTSRTSIQGTDRGNTAHWEGPFMGPFPHSSCATKIRGIQAYHMSKGWADLAYSSVECPHAGIFEGRWFGYRTAANGTNLGNDRHYAHCALMGEGDVLTLEMKRGLREAFLYFESRGSGNERKVHSDWKATECAGPDVNKFVKVDNLWIPSTGPGPIPTPSPTLTLIDTVEIDMNLNTYAVSIGTTPAGQANAGCGWVRVPFERKQIKGYTPPGIRPEHDGRYETCDVGMADDTHVYNPGTVISVEGWAPGFEAVLEITVAE